MTGGSPIPTTQEPPLTPSSDALTDLLTGLVSGLTLIAPNYVRPRWQPNPPQQPAADTDWCSAGIVSRPRADYNYQALTTLPGTTTEALLQARWGELEVLYSFYGPNSDDLAEQFADALQVTLNLQPIYAVGVRVARVDNPTRVPDLVNNQWIGHTDLRVWFARQVDRYYPLQSVVRAVGTLSDDEGYVEHLDSNEAAPP